MSLHVVRETDAGIVVRGAKYETAAAYANRAFAKPTIANRGDSKLSDYAVGFICDQSASNLKFICRTGFAGRAPIEDYPLSNRFDEVDTLCCGPICVTPDAAAFRDPETAPWLEKFSTINETWQAEDRRKMLAFARDLPNSDHAGHRLTFQLFAQSPPYANLAAAYRDFDRGNALRTVHRAAGLSERVLPTS